MFSSATQAGARITLDALEAGAADIATKPSAEHGPEAFRESIADLIRKLRAVAHQARKRRASPGLAPSYTPFLTGPPPNTTRRAMRDIAHLLRPGHLQQLSNILDDPEASANDRFVAL